MSLEKILFFAHLPLKIWKSWQNKVSSTFHIWNNIKRMLQPQHRKERMFILAAII